MPRLCCWDAMPPKLIMKIGPLPDAMEPGIHCVTTHWIRGFTAFQLGLLAGDLAPVGDRGLVAGGGALPE
jgi:hypothetical protein